MINTDTVIPCHYLKPHIDPVRSSEVHSWERKVRIGAISMIALGLFYLR